MSPATTVEALRRPADAGQTPRDHKHRGRQFPPPGSEDQPVSVASRASWFITSPFAAVIAVGNRAMLVGGPFHAKRMGTTRTACGLQADSWKKLWEVPYTAVAFPRCEKCDQVVWTARSGGLSAS